MSCIILEIITDSLIYGVFMLIKRPNLMHVFNWKSCPLLSCKLYIYINHIFLDSNTEKGNI